jgi:hypothetical protein
MESEWSCYTNKQKASAATRDNGNSEIPTSKEVMNKTLGKFKEKA